MLPGPNCKQIAHWHRDVATDEQGEDDKRLCSCCGSCLHGLAAKFQLTSTTNARLLNGFEEKTELIAALCLQDGSTRTLPPAFVHPTRTQRRSADRSYYKQNPSRKEGSLHPAQGFPANCVLTVFIASTADMVQGLMPGFGGLWKHWGSGTARRVEQQRTVRVP